MSKYNVKLISENPDMKNIKRQILKNRGIEDIDGYLNLGTHCLHDYELLGKEKLERIYELIDEASMDDKDVYILVDSDVDGYCSAAMMYKYLVDFLEMKNVKYILNKGKNHGLQPEVVDDLLFERKSEKSLLIIPDAGTNDTELCKVLNDWYDIIVIDHHPKEDDVSENIYATIVNPQICDYPNKNLCGTAVVYKVLQFLDRYYDSSAANWNIDLVGVAMVADVMDLRDTESRFLTTRGLMNIENKLLSAVVQKNSYSISNVISPNAIDAAFYISPMLNACIRTGSTEEKDNLFRAFIEKDLGQTFKYKPRKSAKNPDPVEIDEDFYVHVARVCSNLKSSKQDKSCEKECKSIIEALEKSPAKSNKKLLALHRDSLDVGLVGVLANKLANTTMKPTLVLRKVSTDTEESRFAGSARNFKNSYVENFKQDLLDSGLVEKAKGHANAFGVEILGKNVPQLISWFEEKYKDVDVTKTFYVDYILDGELPYYFVRDINEMKSLFSNFVETPFIACVNIQIPANEIQVLESQNGNKRFSFMHNDVEFIKFKLSEDDEMTDLLADCFGDEILNINVVGKTNVSMYGGKSTLQMIIEEYEVEVLND